MGESAEPGAFGPADRPNVEGRGVVGRGVAGPQISNRTGFVASASIVNCVGTGGSAGTRIFSAEVMNCAASGKLALPLLLLDIMVTVEGKRLQPIFDSDERGR